MKPAIEFSAKPQRNASDVARRVADILSDAKANLVASLPDNWIAPMIRHLVPTIAFGMCPLIAKKAPLAYVLARFSQAHPASL